MLKALFEYIAPRRMWAAGQLKPGLMAIIARNMSYHNIYFGSR